jgi:hypothetical protein
MTNQRFPTAAARAFTALTVALVTRSASTQPSAELRRISWNQIFTLVEAGLSEPRLRARLRDFCVRGQAPTDARHRLARVSEALYQEMTSSQRLCAPDADSSRRANASLSSNTASRIEPRVLLGGPRGSLAAIADSLERTGQDSAASVYWRRLQTLDPGSVLAREGLSGIAARSARAAHLRDSIRATEQARQDSLRLIQLAKQDLGYNRVEARAAERAGDLDRAARYWRLVLLAMPGDAEARERLREQLDGTRCVSEFKDRAGQTLRITRELQALELGTADSSVVSIPTGAVIELAGARVGGRVGWAVLKYQQRAFRVRCVDLQ